MGSTLQVERFTITIAEEILDDLRRRITTLDVWPYTGGCSRPLSAAETAFLAQNDDWWEEERGYKEMQATRPETAAYGLHDSPAAWLLEEWRSWADSGGDLDARFGRDPLLSI
jgi:hypothetical protein